MTDRELLEAAAKAADEWPSPEPFEHVLQRWNPLADDGDAFRLAVKLKMQIWHNTGGTVSGMPPSAGFWDRLREPLEPDPYAATRRAIVRAAAAIGGAQ